MTMSVQYKTRIVQFVALRGEHGASAAEITKVFPRATLKQLESEGTIVYSNKEGKWYIPQNAPKKSERTPEEKEYVKNQEEAAAKKDEQELYFNLECTLREGIETLCGGIYEQYRDQLEKAPDFLWEDVKLKVLSEAAADAESERHPVLTCPSNPGTGEIYHCHELDCPKHGKRNIEEASRRGK